MAIRAAKFRCAGARDVTALAHGISGLSGITGLAVDARGVVVTIHWEDTTVTSQRIELTLNALGYRKCRII